MNYLIIGAFQETTKKLLSVHFCIEQEGRRTTLSAGLPQLVSPSLCHSHMGEGEGQAPPLDFLGLIPKFGLLGVLVDDDDDDDDDNDVDDDDDDDNDVDHVEVDDDDDDDEDKDDDDDEDDDDDDDDDYNDHYDDDDNDHYDDNDNDHYDDNDNDHYDDHSVCCQCSTISLLEGTSFYSQIK